MALKCSTTPEAVCSDIVALQCCCSTYVIAGSNGDMLALEDLIAASRTDALCCGRAVCSQVHVLRCSDRRCFFSLQSKLV